MWIVSASKRWLMEAKIPKDIHTEITCVGCTLIMEANSETVTNSVNFKILSSNSAAAISSWRLCWKLSLFKRLFLDAFDLPP